MTRAVVVGAGISGLAAAHHLHRAGADVTVLDAAERPGGLLVSERVGDWLVEWGANGFLDNAPATLDLVRDVGLAEEVVKAAPASAERFVAHRGRLRPVPTKPQRLLTTPLLSAGAKVRLIREPRVPPRAADAEDESVADFVRRRFGAGALHLADAFVTGVLAADPERTSLPHAFPTLAAMEREHGSVFAGIKARAGAERPTLTSFRDGMGALPAAVAAALPDGSVRARERVTRVRARSKGGFTVDADAGSHDADVVVIALPPPAAGRILEDARVPPTTGAPVAVVAIGFPRADAPGVRGFGYLAPESEERFALGAVYESEIFPGRAPADHVLVRALVGGARHPERAALPDAALVAGVRRDLRELGVAEGDAAFVRVARPGAIPQIEMGHAAVLAEKARIEATHPGLALVGAGWSGVAVNGLLESAAAAARDVAR